jgi:hypothetical protein
MGQIGHKKAQEAQKRSHVVVGNDHFRFSLRIHFVLFVPFRG